MTLPEDCFHCQYSNIDEYPDDDYGDYMVVGCDLCGEWVSPEIWINERLPDWCPLKEMWRR